MEPDAKGLVPLNATHDLPAAPRGAVACDVAAHGWLQAPLAAFPGLRRQPGPAGTLALPPSLLRQADEQTIAALGAVLRGAHAYGLDPAGFGAWGALAAPLYLGRNAIAAGIRRFMDEGAWGVSPHLVPHRSLHSPSGALSFALKMHGPNFGVGGGPGCAAEVLLAAAALLHRGRIPGLWVVFTAVDPAKPPDLTGEAAPDAFCASLALALTPAGAPSAAFRLRVVAAAGPAPPTALADVADLFVLKAMFDGAAADRPVGAALEAGGRVEVERLGPAPRRDAPHAIPRPATACSVPLSRREAER
jgi:hypothetical protein